ncbi:MAG TPA: hypothetical protein PKC76_14395 [Saprospiraceae bacterium]|nr:hypothetical protein [Saprospiraceae bacterium]HMP25321.1 hypothetical protein [Saprospiraceae bacterium]
MTKIQTIIEEIHDLNSEELEALLRAILRRMDAHKQAESILDEYVGSGKGIWEMDAQAYVNELRREDIPSA